MEPLTQVETFEQKAPEVLADLAKHIEFELIEKHAFATDNAKKIGVEIAQRIAHNWGGG